MFRHQMDTMAILLNYGYTQPVLLKAALVHDIVEDAYVTGFYAFEEIAAIDDDGREVMALVNEVTQRESDGIREPKGEFLLRIMIHGSEESKILKMADRISNITSLPCAEDIRFISGYISETEKYIQPYALEVNAAMAEEIRERIRSMKKTLQL